MKKTITILIFLLSFIFSFSQPTINRTTGSNTVVDPRLKASLNFYLPVYSDTLSSLLSAGLDLCGAQIFTTSDNSIWKRDCNPKRWTKQLDMKDTLSVLATKWDADKLTFSIGIERVGNSVSAQTTLPLWNANKLQGIDISTVAPLDTFVLTYNSAGNRWEAQPPKGGGGSGGSDGNNYISSITFNISNGIITMQRVGMSDLTVDLDGKYVNIADTTAMLSKYNFTVASNAELRLNAMQAVGRFVSTRGHFSEGDGGGGFWWWDAASVLADNDIDVIKVTAVTTGRWRKAYNGSIRASEAGIKFDGTDQTARLNTVLAISQVKSLVFDNISSATVTITGAVTCPSTKVVYFFNDNKISGGSWNGGYINCENQKQCFSGTDVRNLENNEIYASWFGVVADDATDIRAGLIRARDASKLVSMAGGPAGVNTYGQGKIWLPRGLMAQSDSIHFNYSISIEVLGAGEWPNEETKIRLPQNKSCWYFIRQADGTGCRASRIFNINAYCTGLSTDTSRHGFWTNGMADWNFSSASNFGGQGFIFDTRGVIGPVGDCSNSRLTKLSAFYNLLNGIYVIGQESSNIVFYQPNCRSNGGSGLIDASFLGIKVIGMHSASNGGRPGSLGIVTHGGHTYGSIRGDFYGIGGAIPANYAIQPGVTSGWEEYWGLLDGLGFEAFARVWNGTTIYPPVVPAGVVTVPARTHFDYLYTEGGTLGVLLNTISEVTWGDVGTGMARPGMPQLEVRFSEFWFHAPIHVPGKLDSSFAKIHNTNGLVAGGVKNNIDYFGLSEKYDVTSGNTNFYADATIDSLSFTVTSSRTNPASFGQTKIRSGSVVFNGKTGFDLRDYNDNTFARPFFGSRAAPSGGTFDNGAFSLDQNNDSSTFGRKYINGAWVTLKTGNFVIPTYVFRPFFIIHGVGSDSLGMRQVSTSDSGWVSPAQWASKAYDSLVLHKTGYETVIGPLTFNASVFLNTLTSGSIPFVSEINGALIDDPNRFRYYAAGNTLVVGNNTPVQISSLPADNFPAVWLGNIAIDNTNYAMALNGGNLSLNDYAGSGIDFRLANTIYSKLVVNGGGGLLWVGETDENNIAIGDDFTGNYSGLWFNPSIGSDTTNAAILSYTRSPNMGLVINDQLDSSIQFRVGNVEKMRLYRDAGLKITTIVHETTDVDKFLVSNGDIIRYRTGAEILSDIGAGAGGGTLTNFSFTDGNAFIGSVANPTTTPTLSLKLDSTLYTTRLWHYKGIDSMKVFNAATYSVVAHTHTFASLTSKPTTLSGFGITDGQPLDADLTTIAGLTATTDNFIQSKAGAWSSRTIAQVKTDLGLTGINSGDQAAWLTTGNTDAVAGSMFIGYTVADNLLFKVANAKSGLISTVNTSFGYETLIGSVTGTSLVSFGYRALRNITSGVDDVAVGWEAMKNATTASSNAALGTQTLTAITTGASNVGVGPYTLSSLTTSSNNTAIGRSALQASNGSTNTAIGSSSLYDDVSGTALTAIGYQSGYNSGVPLLSMDYSTFIGRDANSSADNVQNSMALGYQAQVTKSNQVVIGNSSVVETLLRGNVLFGEQSAPSTPAANFATVYVKTDGLFYGKDDAGTETQLSNVTSSGTYTPTITNVQNVTGSTAYSCQWSRVGNIVTVSGRVDIDPTLTATQTYLDISLPVASNFTGSNELAGVASPSAGTAESAAILANSTDDRAEIAIVPVDASSKNYYFTFTYRVL